MSDGIWDAEYDEAWEIISNAVAILKNKGLILEDIITEKEINDFNRAPRVREAENILNKAKEANSKKPYVGVDVASMGYFAGVDEYMRGTKIEGPGIFDKDRGNVCIDVCKISKSSTPGYGELTRLYENISDPMDALLLAQLAMYEKADDEFIVLTPGWNLGIKECHPDEYVKALQLAEKYKVEKKEGDR